MTKLQILFAGICLTMPFHTLAVVQSDTVVQGNVCVGTDCANGEGFPAGVVTKLKENNNRIRFHDLSAGAEASIIRQEHPEGYIEGAVGQSWRMDANESSNGGSNYFSINQIGLEEVDVLSVGTALDYDCTTYDPDLPSPHRPAVGTIPEGQPTENPSANCEPFTAFVSVSSLVLDGGSTGGVGLGSGSGVAANQIALGNETLLRRLSRVAEAIQETDAFIKSQLDSGVLQDRIRAANELEALLDLAEAEIGELERMSSTSRSTGSGSGGIGSATWLLVLLPLVALRLKGMIRHR